MTKPELHIIDASKILTRYVISHEMILYNSLGWDKWQLIQYAINSSWDRDRTAIACRNLDHGVEMLMGAYGYVLPDHYQKTLEADGWEFTNTNTG